MAYVSRGHPRCSSGFMVRSCVVLHAALMPGEQAYCTRMFLVYTVRQIASACRTVLEHFTYFPCKYVKLHFSDRVNDLSKAHYFFTEVERMTKHIVTREIRDNKTPRTRTRVSLASGNNKMDAGRPRAGMLVMSSMQLKFCIDAPSNVRYNELINYRRRYGRP